MIRRAPRSTLFPTRRSSDLALRRQVWRDTQPGCHRTGRPFAPPSAPRSSRSEEHTSELQSQSNLVCRLLLEKKNKSQRAHISTPFTTLYHTPTSARTTLSLS